jgi:hypothetical protein
MFPNRRTANTKTGGISGAHAPLDITGMGFFNRIHDQQCGPGLRHIESHDNLETIGSSILSLNGRLKGTSNGTAMTMVP